MAVIVGSTSPSRCKVFSDEFFLAIFRIEVDMIERFLQVIATRNRRVGVNAEHSPADAMVWVRIAEMINNTLYKVLI